MPAQALPLNASASVSRPRGEWILAGALLAEIVIFAIFGSHFLSASNGFEIIRLSAELGLLAIASTPVIITGGIDLSVGSMMGLGAVTFGLLWRDHGLPLWLAAVLTLLVGSAGGWLNAVLVARLGIPPLIVTLGTYSLFRGIAEGLTAGADSVSNFPASFLWIGQAYLWGIVPPQAILLAAVAVAYAVLLHRTTIGRALYAIGLSPAAARYSAIPVERRLTLVYVLSGLVSSAAALLYVAHLGQAKADAGTGYELTAITAVVLGGTSIFGGRGTMGGTILGLFAITVLQNGLRLAEMPTELTGILTGVLLIATILIDTLYARRKNPAAVEVTQQDFEMKNSQLTILCGVILIGALLIAGSNWALVARLESRVAGASTITPTRHNPVIAVMPKAKGDPYFVSCRAGAEQAARELGDQLIWDGPTGVDPAKQNEVVEGWITLGVNSIAVSVANSGSISTVLRKAREKGIHVVTWDADADPDARDFFVNQATPQGIGYTLTDEAARILGGKGEFAVITGALSAANQNEWIVWIKKRIAEKYPDIKLATIRPCDDDRDKAFAETQTILKVYPNVRVVMAISAPAVPGAAEAVKQSGRSDVKVIGLSLPSLCKPYVHSGVIESVVLWNTHDLGYLTVLTSDALARGTLKRGDKTFNAGRLGTLEVKGDQVILGKPFIFNKSNIDQFDF